MLTMSIGVANASLWKRSKGDQPSQSATPALMSLTAIELETVPTPRLILRTTATPAYTSYSPTPDTFVVDLTSASKAATLSLPATLPPSVSSISADEVTEMGNRLTRVTLHLTQPVSLEAAAAEKSVAIGLPAAPATSVAAATEPPLPPVTAVPQPPAETPKVEAKLEPKVEPLPEPAKPVAEPNVTTEAIPALKAKVLKGVSTSGSGSTLEVRLTGDGEIAYNAFKLEKPSRIVLDLQGVKNATSKSSITVTDPHVKKIRISQFKSAPDPVTRVVLDLDASLDFKVTNVADNLVVSFGGPSAPAPEQVAELKPEVKPEIKPEVKKEEPKPEPKKAEVVVPQPAPVKAADITEKVPVIAEKAPEWKMPEKHATAVINAPAAQQPPATSRTRTGARTTTTTTSEDVFTNDQQPQPAPTNMGTVLPNATQVARTLSATPSTYTGEPITLKLKDADIKDVLRTFAELTGLNMAIDSDVHASVTVDFTDVPWDQALDIILHQNGLGYILEGNVMRVGSMTRLQAEATASAALAEEQKLNVPLQTVSYKLSYARASEVAALLQKLTSKRAQVIVDTRTNQLIISEIPGYIATLRALIDAVDVPTKQVVIEARIVETSKNFIQQYGFQWGFAGSLDPSLGTGTGLVFPNRVGFTGGPFDFGSGGNAVLQLHLSDVLGTFNLDFALNASEFEGLAKVISAPKVTTQDNVSAEIQSGFQIPYQTRINFTTTIQYVDATLRLSVTPQITEAGTVIMEINVQKNEPTTGLAVEGASGTPLSTRTAHTRLMVRDGGTAVIGGIYQVKDNDSRSRVPFLHQIPVFGNLFKAHNISSSHDELLIFITPRIIRGV